MSEDLPTTPPNPPESEEVHFQAVSDLQQATEASRRVQNIDEMGKTVALAESARKAGDTATAVLTGVSLAATGALYANAMDAQAQHVTEQNQQWSDEANQNLQQQQFEQGLDQGKVKVELPPTPTPQQTTIESPQQIQPGPTIDSPETH